MLNEPPPEDKQRRPHPLEQRPEPESPDNQSEKQRQMVTLHIRVVQPVVTYALIAVNVAIFVLSQVLPEAELNNLYEWGANNHLFVLQYGEYHRLLSAMFLHGGPVHILFNMYALYIIGRVIEGLFGHLRFTIIYFLGGLTGSILSVLLNGPRVFAVGASGAVFAIFGAEMVYLYQHRKLLGPVAQIQLRQLIIIAGLNFAIGILGGLAPGGIQIDNWGHVGGLAGGLIIAWLIGPIFIVRRHPERPDALVAEDINPLDRRGHQVLMYVSGLLALLIMASWLVRGGA